MNTKVSDVKLITIHTVKAARGNLSAIELPETLPFQVKRIFLVHGVENTEIRGEHAHKICWQFLIASSGSVDVEVFDGITKKIFNLNSPDKGLLIPPMIWGTQFNYSSNGVLLVLASDPFDPDDYIHNLEDFIDLKK
jgi:hypothetical protein